MISNSGIHLILDVVGMVSEDGGKDDGRQQDDSTTVPCILEDFGIIASGFQEIQSQPPMKILERTTRMMKLH